MSFELQLSDWVEQHTGDLYSWAVHKISDIEQAKDLVQDTFLAAAAQIHTFQAKSSPKTWLFSILNRKIIDHYRAKIKQPFSSDDQLIAEIFDKDGSWKSTTKPEFWGDDEKNLLDDKDFIMVLKMCMELLPEKWSISVKLKYLLNKNGKEICQDLEINPTNYWQMIHRAKLQLRHCIEKNWFKNEGI